MLNKINILFFDVDFLNIFFNKYRSQDVVSILIHVKEGTKNYLPINKRRKIYTNYRKICMSRDRRKVNYQIVLVLEKVLGEQI